jgi:phytoene dehydrogenase-like protein
MHDAIVIGAGPNGMVAAAILARQGWQVLLLEAKPRPGGALYSEEQTLPGYLHDVGAAFFPFALSSPPFLRLDLGGTGLRWANARRESSHPGSDGRCPTIARDLDLACSSFGNDKSAWADLACWQRSMGDRLVPALLAPLPSLKEPWQLGPFHMCRLANYGARSSANLARKLFRTPAGQRVFPTLALHADLGPNDISGAGIGLVLALLASSTGFPVPVGGARAITRAILKRFEEAGGQLQLETRVAKIIVRQRRVVGVRTSKNEEIPVRRAVLADVGPPSLYLRLLEAGDVSGWVHSRVRRFRYGWGTFKMDWALAGTVPWQAGEAREAAVVHVGDSIAELVEYSTQVEQGQLPAKPYLVIGQQSVADPGRAPPGCHTLWAYTHVPSCLEDGWSKHGEAFADRMEGWIERLAPGFRAMIRGRAFHTPIDLEAMDENLVGGDLGGGSARWNHQLFFRPFFPYFRYRTPIQGLYLCSASTHPGPGVHGACGFNAARMALADHS